MAHSPSDWSTDANEAFRLSLVRAQDDRASLTAREAYEGFHPTFTYPLFGEEEKLYGYRDPKIDLKFASGSLEQYFHLSYTAKLPSSSAVDDIEGTVAKFIPAGYYTDEDEFKKRVEADATAFSPLGTRILTYTRPASTLSRKGKHIVIPQVLSPEDEETVDFEVYHCTWQTPGFREYHRRMQLFILLYIEGGSLISEEEELWEFVVLFEKRKRRHAPEVATYHFVGYSTLYPFYCFPERVRMRLSQFVILPPYQQEGHGSALYMAIYQYVLATPSIAELTVEDPAEAFEDLRDRNDLKMLLADERFMREALGEGAASNGGGGGGRVGRRRGAGVPVGLRAAKKGRLGPPADKAWVEKRRVELKIASRQFYRLIEMLMLKHLDPSDQRAARAYRLQVKERLYRFNYDSLVQLDKKERQLKLEETFQSVRADYVRILALVPK
ncbi:histone acetyltransferase type B catalytic subunit [Sparassis latifolia]